MNKEIRIVVLANFIGLASVGLAQDATMQVDPSPKSSNEAIKKLKKLQVMEDDELSARKSVLVEKSVVMASDSDVANLNIELDKRLRTQETANFVSASSALTMRFSAAGVSDVKVNEIKEANSRAVKTGSAKDRYDLAKLIETTAKSTGAQSVVTVSTPKEGAIVKYQSWAENREHGAVHTLGQPTNQASESLCLGMYYIWTVRNNKPTSDLTNWYTIEDSRKSITIVEQP